MKTKIKKYVSIIISVALLTSLCACSDGNTSEVTSLTESLSETSQGTEISASETTETEKAIPPMDTSPITFSLFINDSENSISFDNPIAAEITERTGVTLEITHPDGETDLDVLTASGTLPDLIYAGERTEELISSEMLVPLDDYIESTGEFFPALYGEKLDGLRYSDGKIYTFGTGGSSPAQFTADGTFQIQYAVLAELGYPEITTLEQLGECLKQYMEKHPECTGLLLCGSPKNQWIDTVSARVNYVLGYPNDGEFLVDNETGEAVYKWTDPRTGEFIKWLNQMYNEGVLDKNSFSLKHDAYLDRIALGNTAAIADYYADYSPAEEKLEAAAKYDRTYCPLPVALDSDTKVTFLADYGFSPADGIAITTSCKEPERAFRFLDWWCGDEAQELVNFGTESINSEFSPDSDSYSADTGAGLFTEPFPMRGLTERKPNGTFYSAAAEKYISSYNEPKKAAAEAYGIDLFAELFPQRDALPVINRTLVSDMEIPALSEMSILLEGLETYVKTEVPNAVTAPAEEFDQKWTEITEWCNANGAERVSELMTEMVKADMGI